MAAIFVSYRREDSRADTGRLTKDLESLLGKGQIFRDIDSIEPGVNYVDSINSAMAKSSACLVIIGPHWLSLGDEQGKRRLDSPTDLVRLEIESALRRQIRVIPVLVGGARMPSQAELPISLGALSFYQSYDLSERRWDYDVEELAKVLTKIPGIKAKAQPLQPEQPDQGHRPMNTNVKHLGRFLGAAFLSMFGLIFVLAGLINQDAQTPLAMAMGAGLLFWAWRLFRKR